MIKAWKDMTPQEQSELEDRFTARQAARNYTSENEPPDGAKHGRPTLQDLTNYLAGHGDLTDAILLPLLRQDRSLKRKFDWLLGQYAILTVPAAAAASTGEIEARPLPGGGRLLLVRSRASEDQVYLIIELPDGLPRSPNRMVIETDSDIEILPLPAPIDGKISILLSATDPVIARLRDQKAELDFI